MGYTMKSDFEEYVELRSRPMITVPTDPVELEMLAVSNALGGEIGELQNIVKKMLRDGDSDELSEAFLYEAGDALHYLTRLVNGRGYSLNNVMEANVDKLEKRLGYRKD